jgi:hypothetical protein
MTRACALFVVAFGITVGGQSATAEDLSRYRGYTLENSFDTVLAASGARLADAKTLHERPAKIQQLDWRAPYVSPSSEMADPVRGITFTFFDGALYQIVVTYDRDRTEGLTNGDVVASLSTTYGAPVPVSARTRSTLAETLVDTKVIAHWDSAPASVTLVRGPFSRELQLILVSKALSTRARTAIREAARLDIIEAPRRELEQQKKDADDAAAASEKARTANKAAFRP